MKNLIITIILLIGFTLSSFTTKAQKYTVTFETDSTGQLPDSIQVKNLRTMDSLVLSSSDTLHLVNQLTSINELHSNSFKLTLYPNPMQYTTTVRFNNPQTGEVKITAYNINGQVVVSNKQNLTKGEAFFNFSGFSAGTYIIAVETESGKNSKVLISTNHKNSTPSISYTKKCSDIAISNQQNEVKLKSQILEPKRNEIKFFIGDTLKLIAFLDDKNDLIEISPKSDTTIVFSDYRNIDGFALESKEYIVELPSESNIPSNKTFTITNAFGDYEVSAGSTKSASNIKNAIANGYDYTGDVEFNKNGGYQLNYLVDNDGNYLMCGLAMPANQEQLLMDAKSTAISMLMTHPLLITSFEENYANIVSTLETLNSFEEYVADVANMIKQKLSQSLDLDYTNVPSYNKVIMEMIKSTYENINLTLAHGKLLFDLQERNNGVLKYTITNFHKRTVHLYPKKVWVDAGGFAIKEEAFLDYEILPVIDIIEPDGLNFWKSTFGIFKNDFNTYKKTTEPMEVDLEDADKLKVEVYGMGKLHKDFDQLTEEELLRMVIVAIHGGYVDFVRPTIDLIIGAKNFKSSGTSSQHFDFRYGSRKYPEVQLIRLLAANFFKDVGEMNTFRRNLEDFDFTAMMCQFGKYSIGQILGDKQPEEEKVRYLNLIYNTGKKWTGISKTPEGFRKVIKSGANQVSAMKNANFVGITIKLGSLAVDVANAVYAYNDSYFREDFYVNKTSEMVVALTSPKNDSIVGEDISDIEFTWDFDRGNYIGAYSFELVVNEKLQDSSTVEHKYNTEIDKYYRIDLSNFNSTSEKFTWQVRVLNASSAVLAESELWNFKTGSNQSIVTGTFTDSRDEHVYKTVKIGNQTWMAENLAYLPSVSPSSAESYTEPYYYVYGYQGTSVSEAKATDNYSTYGVLYNWPAAKAACPSGWHLPTDAEWKEMEMAIGMSKSEADDTRWRGTNEGTKLKAINGWYDNENGTDDYGFSSFPGGYRLYFGNFIGIATNGYWWSATERYSSLAWARYLGYNYSGVYRSDYYEESGFSVRCIRD